LLAEKLPFAEFRDGKFRQHPQWPVLAGRRHWHWRVSIGIPGGFDIGIGGGFKRNTQIVNTWLFDDWSLIRSGAGSPGTVRKECFDTQEEAIIARNKLCTAKCKKGYRAIQTELNKYGGQPDEPENQEKPLTNCSGPRKSITRTDNIHFSRPHKLRIANLINADQIHLHGFGGPWATPLLKNLILRPTGEFKVSTVVNTASLEYLG
jgi:predicted DNA-binding WGR domain protein